MKNKLFIALVFGLLVNQKLLADSPLTSTPFCEAYKDLQLIQIASESKGKLTSEIMNYLSDNSNPIEVKIALINKVANSGWEIAFEETNNAEIFLKYLEETEDGFFLFNASSEILICYAYIKALDNYFDVTEAAMWAEMARTGNEESYTIQIIAALIFAQQAMDSDWCEVYNLTNSVRENKALEKDMREEAISIIFDYMDLYKDDCE